MTVFCKMLPALLGTIGRGGKADFLLPWLDNISRKNAHSSLIENSFRIKGVLYLNEVSGSCKREMFCKGRWTRSWCRQQGREGTVPRPKGKEHSRSGDGAQGQPAVWWLPARYVVMRQVYGQARIRQDPGKIRQGNPVLLRQEPWVRPELKCSPRAAEPPSVRLLLVLSHTALSPESDPRSQGCDTSLLVLSTGNQTALGGWRACWCRSLTKSDTVWF